MPDVPFFIATQAKTESENRIISSRISAIDLRFRIGNFLPGQIPMFLGQLLLLAAPFTIPKSGLRGGTMVAEFR